MSEHARHVPVRDAYVATRHAVRSVLHAGARLPRLPFIARYSPPGPVPGGYHRIYYFHVRKTGGTSLAHAFLALAGEEPERVERRMRLPPFSTASGAYRFVYQDRPLLRGGHYFFGYGHGDVERVRLPEGTFTLTILRDPAERVLSLYRYLIDPRADEGQVFHALDHERRWAADGFMTFLDRVSPAQLMNQLHMFSPTGDVDEAARRILSCDSVLATHTLDEDIGELGRRLELPLVARHVRSSRAEYEPDESELARLREMLEPEYRLLSLVRRPADAGPAGREPRFSSSVAPTDESRPGIGA